MTTKRTPVPATTPTRKAGKAVDALAAGADLRARRVDPRTLTIDANVRADARLDADFIASIREHGVLSPVLVRETTLGELLVVDGQRRTLAAIEADRPDIPVVQVDGIGDDEHRIVAQLISNDQRTDLLAAERVAAYQQLTLLGRSPESIAKKVHAPVDRVQKALAVAASPYAQEVAASTPEVQLDHLAVLAEVAADVDEDPRAAADVERLTHAAVHNPGTFKFEAERALDRREDRRLVAARRAELEAEGVTVLDASPSYSDKIAERLDSLSDKVGGKPLTPAKHAKTCPGHAVFLHAQGYYGEEKKVIESAYCVGWAKHGHVNRYAQPTSGATSGPQTEEQKAERRRLIENNKAAVAAEKVRRAFVTELLQRSKLPADALTVAARIFASTYDDSYDVPTIRAELTGLKEHGSRDDTLAFITTPAKAAVYLLGWAAARVESRMPKDFWRGPQDVQAIYLRALDSWGYTLSDVERLAADKDGEK